MGKKSSHHRSMTKRYCVHPFTVKQRCVLNECISNNDNSSFIGMVFFINRNQGGRELIMGETEGEHINQVASNGLKLPSVSLIEYLTEYYEYLKVNEQLFICIRWQRIRIPINQQIFEVDRILTNSTISVKKWDQTICKFS